MGQPEQTEAETSELPFLPGEVMMTYYVALMRIVRLAGVQVGVVTTVSVPQLAIRKTNISIANDTQLKTQQTIQEFVAALKLISKLEIGRAHV